MSNTEKSVADVKKVYLMVSWQDESIYCDLASRKL